MGFVTPILLTGVALVAVPILLHLIMRREAQQLKFPALRFVQQRRNVNQHRLRLRHLLLLALRCAVIALLAFALARPTLRGSSASGKADAPVATALIFDNSLRMQYEHENRSRFDAAKELAAWVLEQLPPESPVTVVDRAGRQRGQDLDRAGAELRIERLDTIAAVRPMEDALRDAARWLEEKPDHRGEIYVFTDMSAEAWAADALEEFGKLLDSLPGANVYFIDVGAREPRNLALGALRLSSERLAPGGFLKLETELNGVGLASQSGEAVVALYIDNAAGEAEKRGQLVVALSGEQPARVEFSLAGLALGTHQGYVRVLASDPLPADDVRFFSVDVRPPSELLLFAQRPQDALFLREALAPAVAIGLLQPRFACDVAQYGEVERIHLAEYTAVFLIDPPPLPHAAWRSLVDFAGAGGGVGVFLGRAARADELNSAEAQQLLPAKLRWISRDATYVRPVAVEHPALGELRELGDAVPWSEFAVFAYWELAAGAELAHVVASYANGKPALVERQIGAGRVLMMTTSVSDPAHNDPWNLLPTGPDPWPFLALANGIAEYLAGAGEARLNYFPGHTIVLPLSSQEQVTSYVLQMPDGSAVRQALTPGQEELSVASAELLGNYRLRAGGRQERLDRGFSVNLPPEVTRLERVSDSQIVKSLGDERARVARTRDEIAVRVGQARTGRELFPFMILIVALVLAAEQWLANRFYDAPSAVGSRPSASKGSADKPHPSTTAAPPTLDRGKPIADSRQPTTVS